MSIYFRIKSRRRRKENATNRLQLKYRKQRWSYVHWEYTNQKAILRRKNAVENVAVWFLGPDGMKMSGYWGLRQFMGNFN